MTQTSLYSIIQYRPSIARGEGVNVGVVLFSPSAGRVQAKFRLNNEMAKKRFGKKAFDDVRLSKAKAALADRIADIPPDGGSLQDFISREASNLVFLEPRAVVVRDFELVLGSLFDELVGERAAQRRQIWSAIQNGRQTDRHD